MKIDLEVELKSFAAKEKELEASWSKAYYSMVRIVTEFDMIRFPEGLNGPGMQANAKLVLGVANSYGRKSLRFDMAIKYVSGI